MFFKADILNIGELINIRDSIVVSIPACHAGDRGSIPRLGVYFFNFIKGLKLNLVKCGVKTNLIINT